MSNVICRFLSLFSGCFAFTAENRLRNTLFRNYSYIAIPVKHPSDVLNVSFELALDQIIELVSKLIRLQ